MAAAMIALVNLELCKFVVCLCHLASAHVIKILQDLQRCLLNFAFLQCLHRKARSPLECIVEEKLVFLKCNL